MRVLHQCVAAALVMASGLSAGASVFAPDTSPAEWRFKVFLDKRHIGYHSFELRIDEGQQILVSEAEFNVKVLFFNAYRYAHQARERWADGCLRSLDAVTRENGETSEVVGRDLGSQFEILTGERTRVVDPDCVMSFAYWNPAILDADRLLNAQTGEYLDVDVELIGPEPVETEAGTADARRYRLRAGELEIDLWYGVDDDRWLALEAPTKGRMLRYQPI